MNKKYRRLSFLRPKGRYRSDQGKFHWAVCLGCGAGGALSGSREDAIEKWNRRVPRKEKAGNALG